MGFKELLYLLIWHGTWYVYDFVPYSLISRGQKVDYCILMSKRLTEVVKGKE